MKHCKTGDTWSDTVDNITVILQHQEHRDNEINSTKLNRLLWYLSLQLQGYQI